MHQRRGLSLLVLLIFLGTTAWAQGGKPPLSADTVACLYFNAGKIYSTVIGELKNLDKPELSSAKAQLTQVYQGVTQNLPPNAHPGKLPTLDELVKKVLDFDTQAIFQPNGGLWLAIQPDGTFQFALAASLKPKKLYELMTQLGFKGPEPKTLEKDLIEFDLPPVPGVKTPVILAFKTDGITIGAATSEPDKSWGPFLAVTAKPETTLAIEIDGEKAKKALGGRRQVFLNKQCQANLRVLLGAVEMYNMDHPIMMKNLDVEKLVKDSYLKTAPICANKGTYVAKGDLSQDGVIECTLHGTAEQYKDMPAPPADGADAMPDPRLRSLTRAYFYSSAGSARLSIGLSDAKAREELQKMAAQGMEKLQQGLTGALPPAQAQQAEQLKTLLAGARLFNENDAVGIAFENLPRDVSMTSGVAVVGVLAAIAIPNFARARDNAQEKACNANMRVMTGAMEMYNMDHSDPLKTLDLDVLLKKKYLMSQPKCPQQGTYSLEGTGDEAQVRCSKHGPLPVH
jgi:competence protein ComGC